jgi:hypothetical protein
LHLLFISAFLTLPDIVRLTNVLLLHRPTSAASLGTSFNRGWTRVMGLTAKTCLIGFYLIMCFKGNLDEYRQYILPKSPLYGIYDVEEFTRNNQVQPLLSTDSALWRKVIFDYPSIVGVEFMNDSVKYFGAMIDSAKDTLLLSPFGDNSKEGVFTYSQPDANHLVLQGTLHNDSVTIQLQRFDESKFLLLSRKFRWFR